MISLNIFNGSHSKAKVSLVLEGEQVCVLKQADHSDLRFAQAINKQINFRPIALGGLSISSAQILRQGIDKGRMNVVMRYITGMNGDDFALHGDRGIALEISRALSALLLDSMARAQIKSTPTHLFLEKMEDVVKSTHWPELHNSLSRASTCLQRLIDQRESIDIPLGPCHGDLTLSNMIWNPSMGLVLIDFLATFLESPLQDLAKINQELEFGWSFRHMDPNLQIKSQLFSRLAFPSYGHYLYTLFPEASYLFKLLCLARIAPYITDSVSANWLSESLELVIAQAPETNSV
jgi:hypothetical protein